MWNRSTDSCVPLENLRRVPLLSQMTYWRYPSYTGNATELCNPHQIFYKFPQTTFLSVPFIYVKDSEEKDSMRKLKEKQKRGLNDISILFVG